MGMLDPDLEFKFPGRRMRRADLVHRGLTRRRYQLGQIQGFGR